VWLLSYYVIRYFKKSSEFFSKKIDEIKELDSMKNVLLQEADDADSEDDTAVVASSDESIADETVVEDLIKQPEAPMVGTPTTTPAQEHVQKDIEQRQKKLLEKIRYEALLAKEKGKIDEFEKKIVEGLAIDSENLELNQMLADLYFTLGNYKKALTLLKKVIEIEPQDHKAIWQIGEIYLSKGEFETAELLIEKAVDLKPSNPKYHISMVEVYYNTNRRDLAVETLEKVVKLRPANVPYLLALADLYFEIGDMESAQRYYFRVLEYEPSNVKAKSKLQKIV
jgi:tetratricopeptide (TPR) repeat protein